ncbi:MAG: PorT family protein, partial [Bacteroidales bacterium]|nr:PorT family protein [Bacteroidales bacterium]
FSQISFGPKVGVNLSKYSQKYKDSDNEDHMKFRLGPSIGAVMDMPLNDFLSFQPSLMLSVKGTSFDLPKMNPNHTYDGFSRDQIMYIEVPLNFAGKFELGPGTVQVFAGPYFAMAIAGKENTDYTETAQDGSVNTVKCDDKFKFTNKVTEEDWNEDDVEWMRPMDIGINFGVGYQWNFLLFNVGYAMGFSNLVPDYPSAADFDAKDYKTTNRTIFFNVAWLFGGE